MEYENHDLAYAFINPDSKANIPLEFMLNVEFKNNLFLDETVPLRVYMLHYFVGFVKAIIDTKYGLDIQDVLWKRIVYTEYNALGEQMGQKISGLKVSFRKGKMIHVNILKFGDQYQQPIGITAADYVDLGSFYSRKGVHNMDMQIFLNEYNVRRVDHSIKMESSGNNPYEIYVEKIYSNRLRTVFPALKGHKPDSFKVVQRSENAKFFARIEGMFSRMKFGPDRPWYVLEKELMHFLTLEYHDLMQSKFVKQWKGGQQAFSQGILAHLKKSLNVDTIAQGKQYEFQMEIRQKFNIDENLSYYRKKDPIYFLLCFHDSQVELAAAKLSLQDDTIRPLKPLNGPIRTGYKALISFSSDDTKAHRIVSEKPLKIERPNNMITSVNSILKSKDLLKDPALLKDCEILLNEEVRKVLPENQKFSLREWKFLSRYVAGMLSNSNIQRLSLFRFQTSSESFPGSINFLVKNKETGVNLMLSINEQHIAQNEIEKIDNKVHVENFLSKQRNTLLEKDAVVFHIFVYTKHTIDDYHSFDEDSTDFMHVRVVAQTMSMYELSASDMKEVTPFALESMLIDHKTNKQTLSKMFDVMFNQNSDLINTKADFEAFIDGLFHDLHDSVKDLHRMPNAYSKRQVTLLSETPVTINFALNLPFEETEQTCERGHQMLTESKPVNKFKSQTFINVVYDRNWNKEKGKAISLLRTRVLPQEKGVHGAVMKVAEQPKNTLALLWKINQLIWKYAWNKCKNRLFKRSSVNSGQCVYKSVNEIEDRKTSIFEIHVSKLNDIGNYAMNGLLLRDIIADLIHWDVNGLKSDAIFLGASVLSSLAVQSLKKFGASSLAIGQKALGSLSEVTSTILGKSVILYYVIKDLMNNWHLVKNSTSAKVNVAIDAAILTVEGIDLTASALESLGFVAGASAVTGPLAGVTAAVLLIGTNIYQAVDKVRQIDSQIELSTSEKFVEGLLAFAHLNSEDKISKLLDKKAQSEVALNAALDFLKRHEFVKNYIAQCGGEDNFIDLRAKIPLDKSRAMDKHANLFCQLHENVEPIEENILWRIWHKITGFLGTKKQIIFDYNCSNSFGVSAGVDHENLDGVTFYQLGAGNDTVFGFHDNLNIFNLSSGSKEIHGGNMDDIFLLNGWSIFGFVNAYEGYNSVDMSGYVKNGTVNMASYAHVLNIYYDKDTTSFLKMKNIHGITGRLNATDLLHLSCSHKVINLQGGKNSDSKDYILINDESCNFETRITLSGHTKILHQVSRGRFTYLILPHSNTTIALQDKVAASQLFEFNQPFTDMQNFIYSVKNNADEIYFQLANDTSISLNLTRSLNQAQFTFADNVSMSINPAGYPIAYLRTTDSIDKILGKYSELAKKLQITLIAKRMNEQTITLNHGQYILGEESSHEKFSILHSNPDHATHIEEGYGNHVIILKAKNSTMKNVSIDMNGRNTNHNLTIDFTSMMEDIPGKERLELGVICTENFKNCSNIDIRIYVSNDSNQSHIFGHISVNNANLSRINILKHLPLTFESTESNKNISHPSLIPMPMHYPKPTSVIIISQEMIEPHTSLIIAKNVKLLSHFEVNDTLILTNIENCLIFNEKKMLTIVLIDFFKYRSIFNSISFRFEEQTIYLDEKVITSAEIPRLENLSNKINMISDFYEKRMGGGLSMKSFMRTVT